MIVRTDVASLPGTLDEVAGEAVGIVVRADGSGELDALRTALYRHGDSLARWCVGVAVVGPDDVRAELLALAGQVPFPVTALADEGDADAWARGQLAAGIAGVRPAGAGKSLGIGAALSDYVVAAMTQPPDPVQREVVERAIDRFGDVGMTIGEDQGRLLRWLVELTGARRAVEVGTFIGTSAMWIARGLGADGRLTCFELDADYAEFARAGWEAAGVADRVEVVVGPALDGLRALPDDDVIDFAFVDADKHGYAEAVEVILRHLAPRSLIAIDNTLWMGRVVDPRFDDDDTVAIRRLTADLAARDDLDVLLLTVGDGVTLVRRNQTSV